MTRRCRRPGRGAARHAAATASRLSTTGERRVNVTVVQGLADADADRDGDQSIVRARPARPARPSVRDRPPRRWWGLVRVRMAGACRLAWPETTPAGTVKRASVPRLGRGRRRRRGFSRMVAVNGASHHLGTTSTGFLAGPAAVESCAGPSQRRLLPGRQALPASWPLRQPARGTGHRLRALYPWARRMLATGDAGAGQPPVTGWSRRRLLRRAFAATLPAYAGFDVAGAFAGRGCTITGQGAVRTSSVDRAEQYAAQRTVGPRPTTSTPPSSWRSAPVTGGRAVDQRALDRTSSGARAQGLVEALAHHLVDALLSSERPGLRRRPFRRRSARAQHGDQLNRRTARAGELDGLGKASAPRPSRRIRR